MRRVILDTDVASLSIQQQLPPAPLRELLGAQVRITFVTPGELGRWATLRQWGPTRRAELDGWHPTRPTLPYTDDVARLWGEISPHATRRGRPRHRTTRGSRPAAWPTTCPLATLNIKD